MPVTLTEKVKFYEKVFGAGRMARNSRNFDVWCPICAPKDHSKKKLAILVEDDRCHCWVCGYKSRTLAPLIRKYGTASELVEYRDRFMSETTSAYRSRCVQMWGTDEEQTKPPLKLPSDFELVTTSNSNHPDMLAIRRYLLTRNVSEDDMWYYKLGWSNDPMCRRRVVMPSFDKDGELNHYVGRTVDKKTRPKYDAPEGDRHQVIFNEINIDWNKQLVLCEGMFDLMKCGDNAVPLLGSDINEESALFNAILANGTPIALALDADMRLTKSPRIARKLVDYNVDVVMVDVPEDPGAATKKEFKAALKVAQPFDWNRTFFDRLANASMIRL